MVQATPEIPGCWRSASMLGLLETSLRGFLKKDYEGTHKGRGRKRDTIRKKVNDTWKQRMRERDR